MSRLFIGELSEILIVPSRMRVTMEEQWTEKYRPDGFQGILSHEDILQKLENYVDKGSMPHLLFVGPDGVGKTTTALALTKRIYSEDWKANFTELTRSDERGIKAMRGKIKEEAKTRSLTERDFKIIFMEDAEELTESAQSAFRRTMENFSENVRFILTSDSPSKIIDPIQSRCATFRFYPLGKKDIEKWIHRIEENERFQIDEGGIHVLSRIAKGDLRKLTNLLQVAASLDSEIDEGVIKSAVKKTKTADIKGLILKAQKGDFMEVREDLYVLLIEKDYSAEKILEEIHEEIYNLPMDKERRKEIAHQIGEIDFDLARGSRKRIHLQKLLAFFSTLEE